jgi:hypothetical protein
MFLPLSGLYPGVFIRGLFAMPIIHPFALRSARSGQGG